MSHGEVGLETSAGLEVFLRGEEGLRVRAELDARAPVDDSWNLLVLRASLGNLGGGMTGVEEGLLSFAGRKAGSCVRRANLFSDIC